MAALSDRFVYGEDQRVTEFVRQQIKRSVFGFKQCVTIGMERDGELIAGAVYYDWHEAYGNIHVALAGTGRNWCNRAFLRRAYAYPFVQMKCSRITAVVAADNLESIKFVRRLGFVQEGNIRNGFGNMDCLVFGQLRNEVKPWV